jgi:hypothetical protein
MAMYSLDVIKIILTASGLFSPEGLAQRVDNPHRYYYPLQTVTEEAFRREQWEYLRSQKENLQNRCVVFLIESKPSEFGAIILLLSDIDPNIRRACLELFSGQDEKSLTYESLTSSHRSLLASLYRRVSCWLVGNVSTWRKYLEAAYMAKIELRIQPINSEQCPDIVFTECVLRIVKQEPIGRLDVSQIMKQHHQLCYELFRRWWKHIANTQPSIFVDLVDLVRRLLKYTALQESRRIHAPHLAKASSMELSVLLLQDQAEKKEIYQQPLSEVLPLLKKLSFSPLVGLLKYREPENLRGLMQLLQTECKKQQTQVAQWETTLGQMIASRSPRWVLPGGGWKRRRRIGGAYLTQLVIQQIHQHTLIGLGADLTPLFGLFGLRALGLTEVLAPEQQRQLFKSLRWIGSGLVGGYFSYTAGSYHFIKSLLIGNLSHWFHNFLRIRQLDDTTATVRKPPLGIVGLARMFWVSFAAMESLWQCKSNPFIEAIGGILGSAGAIGLGSRLFADLLLPEYLTSAEINALLFLCSLGGYTIGSLLFANTLNCGINKILTRKALSEAFCGLAEQNHYQGCITDFSETPTWSPRFWTSNKDTVRLGWSNKMKDFHEATCDVIPLISGEHAVECCPPVLQEVRRLG